MGKTPRPPLTPAEKEMLDRDLPPSSTPGEDMLPIEQGGLRHPRTEGQGGLSTKEPGIEKDGGKDRGGD